MKCAYRELVAGCRVNERTRARTLTKHNEREQHKIDFERRRRRKLKQITGNRDNFSYSKTEKWNLRDGTALILTVIIMDNSTLQYIQYINVLSDNWHAG